MDYVGEVSKHVKDLNLAEAAKDWWENLCENHNICGDESIEAYLKKNIEASILFILNSAYPEHINDFCIFLGDYSGSDPVESAARAIEASKKMALAGPIISTEAWTGEAQTFISRESFFHYIVDDRQIDIGDVIIKDQVIKDLESDHDYYKEITKNGFIRSWLPIRFWTSGEDLSILKTIDSFSAIRLIQFLGLDWTGPGIIISINSDREPDFFIPTGWDGFTHKHFRENSSYDPKMEATHVGYTIDLKTNSRGAREVVTIPINVKDSLLVMVVK